MSLYKYFEKAQVVERDLEVSETRLSECSGSAEHSSRHSY